MVKHKVQSVVILHRRCVVHSGPLARKEFSSNWPVIVELYKVLFPKRHAAN